MKKKDFLMEIDYDKEKLKKDFLEYHTNIDIKTNIEKSIAIFKYHLDIDFNFLSKFIKSGIKKYNNVPYHNAIHAFNTLKTGSIYLKFLSHYKIKTNEKLMFLICCYLHDIGHPGLTEYRTKSLDYETFHINLVKELLHKYFKESCTDENFKIIEELIFSTNLLNHEKILEKFIEKYYENVNGILKINDQVKKEMGVLELRILIKLADISASYKDFKSFKKGSDLLEEEIFGKNTNQNPLKMIEDLDFIKNFSLPLAKYFSNVFTDLDFLYENGTNNLTTLEELIKKTNK